MGLFSFDPATETPQMLAERRLRAQYVANRIGGGQASIGNGIGDIFRGLSSGLSNYMTDQNQVAGNAYGQSAVDRLNGLLSTPTSNPGLVTPPSNDVVGSSIKSAMATGQTPQLSVYIPPPQGSGAPTGQIQNGIDPTQANPIPQPMVPAPAPAPASQTAISVPGYDGTFTQSQANDGDGVPSQAEWLAARGGSAPASAQAPNPALAQPAPMVPASNDMGQVSKIMQVLNNPWVSDADKEVLKSRLAQIQQRSDPAYQQKMQLGDVQIQQAKQNLSDSQGADIKISTDANSGDTYQYDAADPKGTIKLVRKADPSSAAVGSDTAQIKNYSFSKTHPDFANFMLGKPPNGYQWGADNADGTHTLVPIEGGDKTPGSMKDPAYQDLVKGWSNYDIAPPSAGRNPAYRNKVLEDIRSVNPNYDETMFEGKKAQERALASGQIGNTTQSLGVSVAHLSVLADLGKALKTGDIQSVNAAKQAWQTQFGTAAPVSYDFARSIVADEIAKSVIGGQNAQSDREALAAKIRASNSPEQMEGVIKTAQSLMAGQLSGLRKRYDAYHPGANNFDKRFLSDETTAALSKFIGGSAPSESSNPALDAALKKYQ